VSWYGCVSAACVCLPLAPSSNGVLESEREGLLHRGNFGVEASDAIFTDALTRNLVTDTAISMSGGLVGATVFAGFGKVSSDQWSLLCIISFNGTEQEICYNYLTDGLDFDTTYIVVHGNNGEAFLCCAAVDN
jgi:hypothetical protein